MNKLLYLSAAALFSLSASAYAASVVESSSPLNWSDSSTWAGGTLPTDTDSITFEGNNTQLVVDQSVTASNITLSEGQSQTIDISQNSTLKLSSLTGTGESSLLTVTGSGKLISLSTATNVNVHFNMSGGTLENPALLRLGFMEGASATSSTNSMRLVFTGHYVGVRVNGFFNSTFILDENSSYRVDSGHWNMWGGGAKFIMKAGSNFTMKSTEHGFNAASAVMDVAGNITINGKYDLNQGQSYTMNWSNATFRAGASITQTATAASVNPTGTYLDWRNVLIRNGTTTIESGVEKNALNFQSIIYFGADTTLVLNSSDVFKSGVLQSKNGAIVQQEQGKTTFYLQDRVWTGSSYRYGASNFILVNNADNNIGAFAFWTDSTLTLKLDGKSKLAINDLQHMEGASGYIQVFIENLGRDKLFFGDLVFENPDVYFYDPDTLDLLEEGVDYELVSGIYNGVSGKWMNAIVVPEPSTFAAIFGVVALAVILRRRRG